ncbi:MAG: FHA domain-containing protein [Gammaproteobacteria bacterium]|nr:FHA domain-containing protein [Gammaproteobacteria bacterium]
MTAASQAPVLRGMSAEVRELRLAIADELTLGSNTAADVNLSGAGVAADHARLRWDQQTLLVERGSEQAELFVNGKAVTRQQLNAGDELRIGAHRFVVKMPALRPQSVLRDVPAEQAASSLRWWLLAAALLAAAASVYWYVLR